MTQTHLFQRLERTASLIARHPFYVGKHDAVRECIQDIEERCLTGALTVQQKTRLVGILLDDTDARVDARTLAES